MTSSDMQYSEDEENTMKFCSHDITSPTSTRTHLDRFVFMIIFPHHPPPPLAEGNLMAVPASFQRGRHHRLHRSRYSIATRARPALCVPSPPSSPSLSLSPPALPSPLLSHVLIIMRSQLRWMRAAGQVGENAKLTCAQFNQSAHC